MKIKPDRFFNILSGHGITFFTGVPDSLLKSFCLCLDNNIDKESHIITANEGSAIGLAAGYYLGTKNTPLVYMQNSGLGNAINPLLSLSDPEVYSIPMLLLIGWRGEPGVKDEPQHKKQGRIQLDLLKTLEIPFEIISNEDNNNMVKSKVDQAVSNAKNKLSPSALLIKKNTFENYSSSISKNNTYDLLMNRESSLKLILESIDDKDVIISTTGKTSRELFELIKKEDYNNPYFLVVGSMGHCSSIAQGIALTKPDKKIICIDGDGSLLMHMGSLAMAGQLKLSNFYHFLINNYVHESVGGQQTASKFIDYNDIAKGLGYLNIYNVDNIEDFNSKITKILNQDGPSFLEIRSMPGSRKDLGRPDKSPVQNKEDFIQLLNN